MNNRKDEELTMGQTLQARRWLHPVAPSISGYAMEGPLIPAYSRKPSTSMANFTSSPMRGMA